VLWLTAPLPFIRHGRKRLELARKTIGGEFGAVSIDSYLGADFIMLDAMAAVKF
jgi:hypothetical protein